jgi:hypothetical protein
MTDPVDSHINAFRRRIMDDPTKIESVCKKCGAFIVGSVLEGLPEREAKHFAECEFNPKNDKNIAPSKS